MSGYWSKSLCSKGERKFQGNKASPINDCWRQKSRFSGLSRGFVCVIRSLIVLTQYRRVTDGRTDRRTNTMTAITALA